MVKIKLNGKGGIQQTKIGDCEVLDEKMIIYPKSGKFFIQRLYKDLLKKLAADMHNNVADNYDNVVMVSGGEGSGKSNAAFQILQAYCPDFDMNSTYVYNMDGIRERFAMNDYGGGLFWMDETSQIASNRTWQSDDNKDLVSILETSRSKGFTIVGCVPKLDRVDLYLREVRMQYHIIFHPMSFPTIGYKKRGIFELYKRNRETLNMDHVGYGLYDPMPPEAAQIYEPIKADFQERFRRKIAEGKEKGGKYKEKWIVAQNLNVDAMTKLHDLGLVDDDQLMQIFGYENKRTYQNAMSRSRLRN